MKKIGQFYQNLLINGERETTGTENENQKEQTIKQIDKLENGNQKEQTIRQIDGLENNPIIKLGIQAPPGSIFVINNHQIMIGLSGIYELEEPGIKIKNLSFATSINDVIIDYVQEEGG